jgi:hypothetical protein
MVGHQKAGEQGLSGSPRRAVSTNTRLDWDQFFRSRPDLSPPGYEEAVEAVRLQIESRKQAKREEQAAKSKPKSKR